MTLIGVLWHRDNRKPKRLSSGFCAKFSIDRDEILHDIGTCGRNEFYSDFISMISREMKFALAFFVTKSRLGWLSDVLNINLFQMQCDYGHH